MDDSKTNAKPLRAGTNAKAANVRHHLQKLLRNGPQVTKATRDKQFEALRRAIQESEPNRRHKR